MTFRQIVKEAVEETVMGLTAEETVMKFAAEVKVSYQCNTCVHVSLQHYIAND